MTINSCDNMPKKKGEGFHSAAGLIRYFDDEDEKSPKIPPWVVVGLCIGSAIFVTLAAYIWPA
jgi:preprotein translocase subunit Sec61beta